MPSSSVWRMRNRPWPASMSSASSAAPRARFSPLELIVSRKQFGIGRDEVRGRQRTGDLPQVELRFGASLRVDVLRLIGKLLGPRGADRMRLPEEVEHRVAPVRGREPLVALGERHHGIDRLALEATVGLRPELQEWRGDGALGLGGTRGIAHPVLGDAADGGDGARYALGHVVLLRRAGFERPEIGREHLAALLDETRRIGGEPLDVRRRTRCFDGGRIGWIDLRSRIGLRRGRGHGCSIAWA